MLRTRIVKADSGVFVLTYNCPQGSWKQAISPASKRLVGLSLQSPSWESASTSPGLPASGPLVLTPLPILGDHGQVFNTTEEECPKLATSVRMSSGSGKMITKPQGKTSWVCSRLNCLLSPTNNNKNNNNKCIKISHGKKKKDKSCKLNTSEKKDFYHYQPKLQV